MPDNLIDIRGKEIFMTLKDGVERPFTFDMNAMAELEERYGSVEAAFALVQDKNSIKALRTILWAGLATADETLTEKQVGALIDVNYLNELQAGLAEAVAADLPGPEQTEQAMLEGPSDPNV